MESLIHRLLISDKRVAAAFLLVRCERATLLMQQPPMRERARSGDT